MKDRIKKIRRDLDLTQNEFADRIGIKRGAIANYEIGRNEPADSVISLICREFGVSEEWIRTGSGEMFVPAPTSELDALASRYGLSHGDYVMIEKFVNLSAADRKVIFDFAVQIAEAVRSDDVSPYVAAAPASGSVEDAEELYRKSLSSAQNTGSSASNITGDIVQNKKEA